MNFEMIGYYCEADWKVLNMSNGVQCYKFSEHLKIWSYANSECKSFSSHLPTPNSESDQAKIFQIIKREKMPFGATWIGLKRWWNMKWVEDFTSKPIDKIGYSRV